MSIIRGIFFILLALALIICTAIFIFSQTFDTDQYLPQITKKASFALGRPVSIKHVGLGLSSRGITLDAWPLIIADDTAFTTEPFIEVDRVRISLDIKSLILQRKINIIGILLQSPQIHFIRSQEGNINVRSIGQAGSSSMSVKRPNSIGIATDSVIARSEATRQSPNSEESWSSGTIKITIQDAAISFIDQNQTIPLDVWLTNINASLNDFSLSKPFQLSFDACLYNNVPNVQANAILSLDLSKPSAQISDLSLHIDLPQLNDDQLKGISPAAPDSPVLKDIAGVVQLNMADLEMGPEGNPTANGNITITGGVIKNFNIIKALLSRASGVFGNIDDILNGQLKDTLGANDTILEKAQVKFSLHDKGIFIDDSLIKTNIFELTARGSVDQGSNTDMQTMLHLNTDVSAALVNVLEGLKYMMDDSQRITIGASLKGVIPNLKYKPNKDFKKKSRKAMMEEGKKILGSFFGR